jgi:c-di-GMP-binding flagellar brake protein YcgR
MGQRKYLTTVRRKKKRDDKPKSKEGLLVVERRKHPRISVELPMDYSLVDHKENHGGLVVNISEGGLLVYLPEALQIGTLLKIEILFVKGTELNSIKGFAKIAWSDLAMKTISNENRYGLEFQSFIEGDLEKLEKLLKEVGETHSPLS